MSISLSVTLLGLEIISTGHKMHRSCDMVMWPYHSLASNSRGSRSNI